MSYTLFEKIWNSHIIYPNSKSNESINPDSYLLYIN